MRCAPLFSAVKFAAALRAKPARGVSAIAQMGSFETFALSRSAPKGGRKKPLIPRCYRSYHREGNRTRANVLTKKPLAFPQRAEGGSVQL